MRKTPQYCRWNCSCVQNKQEPAVDCELPSSRCSDPHPRTHSGFVREAHVARAPPPAKTPFSAENLQVPPLTQKALPPKTATARWPPANPFHNVAGKQPGSKLTYPSPASFPHSTTAVPLRYHPAAKKSANAETTPPQVRTETPEKIPGLSPREASSE